MSDRQRRGVLGVLAGVLVGAALAFGVWEVHRARRAVPAVAAELQLSIIAPDSRPAAAAAIALAVAGQKRSAVTGASGSARLQHLPLGAATLEVTRSGSARARRSVVLARGANRLKIALEPEAKLAGFVVDDAGAAIADVELRAKSEADEQLTSQGLSDAAGHFALGELAPGRYTLEARAPHHELAVLPGVVAPSGDHALRVVMQRASSLRGEVLDADGKPAAGTSVTVAGSGLWPPATFVADALGRFALPKIAPGVYELRAVRGDFVAPAREGVVLQPASEVFIGLRLEPGASLLGRVVDAETGRPLARVPVRVVEDALAVRPLQTETDADGRFAARGLRQLPHRIWIRAPGYVAVAGESRDPAPELLEFALQRGAVLSGVVLDERGAEVPDAQLQVTGKTLAGTLIALSPDVDPGPKAASGPAASIAPSPDNLGVTAGSVPKVPLFELPRSAGGPPAFHTDGAGRFRIEGVPPGSVRLIAHKSGYAAGFAPEQAVRPGAVIEDLRVLLPRGGTVAGRVLDERDFPVEGIRLQLEAEGEPSPRVTLSGEDGRFEISAVRGRCTLLAVPLAGAPVEQRIELGSGERREIVVRIRTDARTLRGRVVDARGFPIERARVQVEAPGPRPGPARSAISGADGTFAVSGLGPPPYRIETNHPDYASNILGQVSPPSNEEVSIQLRKGARVLGLVVDGLTNNGLSDSHVILSAPAHTPVAGRSNARGHFEFSNLALGRYEVRVEHEGYLPNRTAVVLAGPEPRELDPIALRPAGSISGEVVDRLGAPLLGAEVALGSPPAWEHAVRTDRVGRFRLTGAAPGDSWLTARHPDAGTSQIPVPVRIYARQESPGLVLRLPGP